MSTEASKEGKRGSRGHKHSRGEVYSGGNLFPPPVDEAEQMNILSKMVAHSQYTMSGDNTLRATAEAIERSTTDLQNDTGDTEHYTIVVSDANFERYGISPQRLSSIMTSNATLASGVHVILLASMDEEAQQIVQELPVGHGHVCLQTTDLPNILKDILSGAIQ